jgi:ABC-type multidrug transport system permease subunit
MYSWTALLTAQILVEAPWNILGSTLYFLTWYWTLQFSTERAGYAYLGVGVFFPIYYTTIAQAIASMAPNTEVAAILFGFLFSFVLTLSVLSFLHGLNAFDPSLQQRRGATVPRIGLVEMDVSIASLSVNAMS